MSLRKLYLFICKVLMCSIVFLCLAIFAKSNNGYKLKINQVIYNNNLSFGVFRNLYDKYFGGVFPISTINIKDTSYVFGEQITYSEIENYEEGVKLKVGSNYVVPNLRKGIVVYIGNKDKYNEVVIVEGDDGIDTWYGNLCNISVKLYDTVEIGTYLGEGCSEFIYLVYTRDNVFLDYRDYLN